MLCGKASRNEFHFGEGGRGMVTGEGSKLRRRGRGVRGWRGAREKDVAGGPYSGAIRGDVGGGTSNGAGAGVAASEPLLDDEDQRQPQSQRRACWKAKMGDVAILKSNQHDSWIMER